MFVGWKVHVLLEENKIEKAHSLILKFGCSINDEITHANETTYMAFSRVLLSQNRLDDAEFLLSKLYKAAKYGKRIERLIDARIFYAQLYELKGEHDKAVNYLVEAMEFASKENLLIFFVSQAKGLKGLLQDAFVRQATSTTKISNNFISRLKNSIEKKEKQWSVQNNNELSARELDTLKLVALNYTNQEIADKLFISLNTVKTRLKNIFLKLEVGNRRKAVEKAKEIEIL